MRRAKLSVLLHAEYWKKSEPTDWRFTMEQIGRELRKVYPAREKLPPQLRTLARQIEGEIGAQRRGRRSTKPKGD